MKSKIVWGIKIKSEEQRVESKEQNFLFAWIAKVANPYGAGSSPLSPTPSGISWVLIMVDYKEGGLNFV